MERMDFSTISDDELERLVGQKLEQIQLRKQQQESVKMMISE